MGLFVREIDFLNLKRLKVGLQKDLPQPVKFPIIERLVLLAIQLFGEHKNKLIKLIPEAEDRQPAQLEWFEMWDEIEDCWRELE